MKHGQVFNNNFPSVFRFLVSLGMTSPSEKKGREQDGGAVPLPAFTPILQTVIPTEGRNLILHIFLIFNYMNKLNNYKNFYNFSVTFYPLTTFLHNL
jgi:hypothetical protein